MAQRVEEANRKTASEILEHLLEAVPFKVHAILTPSREIPRRAADKGIQLAGQRRNRDSVTFRKMLFDPICGANSFEHRLTKPNHPWTNGSVERMNRTIRHATVKRHHYDSHDQLLSHLSDVLDTDKFARRFKTLSGFGRYEYICKFWTSEPKRSILMRPTRCWD